MRREKFRRAAAIGYLPGGGLGPFLAELKRMRFRRLGPRAAHASESVGFVLMRENTGPAEGDMFAGEATSQGLDGTPSARGMRIGGEFGIVFHGRPDARATTMDVTILHRRGFRRRLSRQREASRSQRRVLCVIEACQPTKPQPWMMPPSPRCCSNSVNGRPCAATRTRPRLTAVQQKTSPLS